MKTRLLLTQNVSPIRAGNDGKRNTVAQRTDGPKLPAPEHVVPERTKRFRRRSIPQRVDHKDPFDVEVRQPLAQSHVVRRNRGQGVLKRVAGEASRRIIQALAPGEGTLHLKAAAHSLVDSQLKTVVIRAACPYHSLNRPHV